MFLVIPDANNGGADFEAFVVASTPEEACVEYCKSYVDFIVKFKLEPDEPFTDDQRDELWIVREVPVRRELKPGVLGWHDLQCTFWRLLEE